MARPQLTNLINTDTFNTWFGKTNSIINEVNFMTANGITGITGSNGIGITTDGNKQYTVRFTGNVSDAVTFSGPVAFLGAVNASSLNVSTTTIAYSPKKTGLTAGNVVRIDATNGLTFAKADSADNSEVFGIIVGEDTNYNYVAVSGKVDNSTFSNTIRNALGIVGGTLGKGSAYFLSPTVSGGITTVEPNTFGMVSKPVLLGITGDSGIILPYRGFVVEGISAGITSELDNKIIIQIDYSSLSGYGFTNGSNINSPNPIKIGDPVFYGTGRGSVDLYEMGYMTMPEVLNSMFGTAGHRQYAGLKLAGLDPTGEVGYWIADWANCRLGFDDYETLRSTDTTYIDAGWLNGIGAHAVENKRVLGLVSGILTTPATTPNIYTLELTLPGGSFRVNDFTTELDNILYPIQQIVYDQFTSGNGGLSAGSYIWAPRTKNVIYANPYTGVESDGWARGWYRLYPDGIFGDTQYEELEKYPFLTVIKDSSTSGSIIFNYHTVRQFDSRDYGSESASKFTVAAAVGPSSGNTGSSTQYNHLPNGSFSIWQRPFSGFSGATAGSLGYQYLVPIADRWAFTQQSNTVFSGLTLTLQRKEFDSTQTEVPGSPLYYVDIKTQYTPTNLEYRPRLENIQKNARLLQGQTATLSFYAKSTVSGATLDLTFNRYEDGLTDAGDFENYLQGRSTILSGVSLGTAWTKYSHSFIVPVMGYTLSPSQNEWIAFGFEFPNSSAKISLAQVVLEGGYGSSLPVVTDLKEELTRCKQYYQRSYDIDEANQSTNFRGNEQSLLLGNLNGQVKYPVKFQEIMVGTPSVVTVYSPTTGTATEAYNVNAGQDLKYTAGTLINHPWNVTPQYRLGGGLTGNTSVADISKYGYNLQVNAGAASFDTIKFHWVADADLLYRS